MMGDGENRAMVDGKTLPSDGGGDAKGKLVLLRWKM